MRSFWKGRFLKYVGVIFSIAVLMLSIIPIRIAMAFRQEPIPQAYFLLGGDFSRTVYTAQLWKSHQAMPIWVSDFPELLKEQSRVLTHLGVAANQIYLDGRATDTVTNFTTLADVFERQGLRHLYLVTSDYHMQRASTIAMVVLGSRGIAVTPIAVQSDLEFESELKVIRDLVRSILWLVTGRTGASLNTKLPQLRDREDDLSAEALDNTISVER